MAETLDELLKLIRGETGLSAGLTTCPKEQDVGNKTLHEGCIELERQGLIFRARNEEDFVLWKPLPCDHGTLNVGSAVSRTLRQDGSVKSYVVHTRVACADCQTQFVFEGDPKIISGQELRCLVRPKVVSQIVLPKFRLRRGKTSEQ